MRRKSHGPADMPLACLLGRPFRIRPPSTHTTKNHYPMDSGFCGGGGRIRTIEAKRSRFTVCPLWPLGNSPIFGYRLGAGRRTRTPDLLITNQLLYQLSYTGGSNRTRLLYHGKPICQAFFAEKYKKLPGRKIHPGSREKQVFALEKIRIPRPSWQ